MFVSEFEFSFFFQEFFFIFFFLMNLLLINFLFSLRSDTFLSHKLRSFLVFDFSFVLCITTSFLFLLAYYQNSSLYLEVFRGQLVVSGVSLLVKFFVFFLTGVIIYLVKLLLSKNICGDSAGVVEFMCFSSFFSCFLISSNNFFMAFIGMEGAALATYLLSGMLLKKQVGIAGSIKYFCFGSISSVIIFFSISIFFGIFNSLDFIIIKFAVSELQIVELPTLLKIALFFLFFGSFFKLSVFPFHFWVPDVYEGISWPTLVYFLIISRIGIYFFLFKLIFFVFIKFFFIFKGIFIWLATLTYLSGALGALLQTKIKRFLAYTSINQVGLFLLLISCGSSSSNIIFFFLSFFFYTLTALLFFFIVFLLNSKQTLEFKPIEYFYQMRGLGSYQKCLSLIILVVLLNFGSFPPTMGFFSKFLVLLVTLLGGHPVIFIFFSIISLFSFFYYLKILQLVFFEVELENVNFIVVRGSTLYYGCIFSLFMIVTLGPLFINCFFKFFSSLVFLI